MQDFKKLKVWQLSHELTLHVYKSSETFPKSEQFGITNQLRRCTSSVGANLAEGCGKFTQNDILRFFQISLGSAHETENFLLLAKDLKYLSEDDFIILDGKINHIKAMLINLIKKGRNVSR